MDSDGEIMRRRGFVPIYNGPYAPPGYESVWDAFERMHEHIRQLETPWYRRLWRRVMDTPILTVGAPRS